MPIQNTVLDTLRHFTSDPAGTTLEYVKRDMLNVALGNTDNHPHNTAILSSGKQTGLAPLYDFSPSHLMTDDIARSLEWVDERGEILDDWGEIIRRIAIPEAEREYFDKGIRDFTEKLAGLEDRMKNAGIDDDIIDARYYSIANLRAQLNSRS